MNCLYVHLKFDINILLKDNSWIKGKVKSVKESTLETKSMFLKLILLKNFLLVNKLLN